MASDDEDDIVVSPLCQVIHRNGASVEVHIYRGHDEEKWILEVVDAHGTSTVWDDQFESDKAALDEALVAIDFEGISAFLTEAEAPTMH